MPKFNNPVSIGALAKECGVTRQRIYNMEKRGPIKAKELNGNLVFSPSDAELILDAMQRIDTAKGSRIVFDFI